MAVVINEFEVLPGDATPSQASMSTPGEAANQSPPSAREIALLLEQAIERDERVWAH
jgi:hypothetical protein